MALKSPFSVSVFFRSLIRPNVKEAWLTLFKLDTAILTLPLLTRTKRRLAGASNKAALQEKNCLSRQNFLFRLRYRGCLSPWRQLESKGRTEEYIGNWLKGRREQIVLATKFAGEMGTGPNDRGGSRKHILQAVEASLRRLQTDYIDLYQMHSADFETPLDETLRALDDLVHSGKVRYIGCSNYPAWWLTKALWISDKLGLARFNSVQPRYNLLFRHIEAELLPLALDQGIGVISYNPLAGGMLTGRYQAGQSVEEGTRFALQNAGQLYRARYWQEAQLQAVDQLKQVCDERKVSITQVAIAWVLAQPAITSAIVGASKAGATRSIAARHRSHPR